MKYIACIVSAFFCFSCNSEGGIYEYEREYNLNSMPNRIDYLVIKLDEEQTVIHANNKYEKSIAHSENGISKLCRRYNIFEYKSPGQQDEYYVAMAYAYLYTGKTKNASMEEWLKALSDKLTLDDAKRLAADALKEKDDEGRKLIMSIGEFYIIP